MSRVAYVLMECESGKEADVLAAVQDLEAVTEVHGIFGDWDLIARLELEGAEDVMEFVVQQVRGIAGILETDTLLTTEPFAED